MQDYLLHHLLGHSAKQYPEKEAFVYQENSITYAELEKKSGGLALKLLQMGVKRGDRIGIFLGKSLEMIISLFGILKAGGIYVPIDPLAPWNRVAFIIKHCGIECLIASSKNMEKLFSGFHGRRSPEILLRNASRSSNPTMTAL